MLFLCVCDREWCYCTNRVMTQGAPCFMCLDGAHQERPDPIRPPLTDEEPWYPYPPDLDHRLKPGCFPSYRALFAVFIPFAAASVLLWAVVVVVVRRLVGV
jgi:hypothetical protein